jgi:hypothetical protein
MNRLLSRIPGLLIHYTSTGHRRLLCRLHCDPNIVAAEVTRLIIFDLRVV